MGITVFIVALIAVVLFFPRITENFGDKGKTTDLEVMLVKADDAAQADMVHKILLHLSKNMMFK